jgi:hypothetical protein
MKTAVEALDRPVTCLQVTATRINARLRPVRRLATSPYGLAGRLVAACAGVVVGLSMAHPTALAASCQGENNWLPATPAPTFERPPPHPAPDCGFYRPAWQTFLRATDARSGGPAFLSYPTIADVFGADAAPKFAAKSAGRLSLAPRALKGSNDPTTDAAGHPGPSTPAVINAGARQAGLGGLLIDQNGKPIFYAIHMNEAFAAFIREKQLTTKTAVQNADRELEFPKGVVELKSAWQVVPENNVPANYITSPASVPVLKRVGNTVDVDSTVPPREATVALLALHVVFVVEGHPEFVWATFEHVDANGMRDLAPVAQALPSDDNGLPGGVDGPVDARGFTLYKAATAASAANRLATDAAMAASFDEATQSFTANGVALQTSVYRIYPGSKTTDLKEDDDISDLNNFMASLFVAAPNDARRNYRLVGAIWLDQPEKSFAADKKFANPPSMSTDDPAAIVAGEDGLSSMAMESFTQNSFVNCFSCHDTRQVKDPTGTVLLSAKKLNVSHILSKFVSESK